MKSRSASAVVMFDVTYVDGTVTSRRKVAGVALGGLDGDEPAKHIIAQQDREIGQASGRMRPDIKSITRSKV